MLSLSLLLIFSIVSFRAGAVTFFDDAQMELFLNEGGSQLAWSFGPVWNFQIYDNQPMCYPTWAFGGDPNQNNGDTYEAAFQTPGQANCAYPDVGCNCRNPGVTMGKGPQFPVYYTYDRCSDSQVRVSYNLFYEKDGAIGWWPLGDTGHPYDWENVIVSLMRDPDTSLWTPSSVGYGGHGRWYWRPWDDLYTIDDTTIGNADPSQRLPETKGSDQHPFVYPSWSKHANFFDPLPKLLHWLDSGIVRQSTCAALRYQDVWTLIDQENYIRADRSTAAGQAIDSANWGGATGTPAYIHYTLGLCSISGKSTCEPPRDELLVVPSAS